MPQQQQHEVVRVHEQAPSGEIAIRALVEQRRLIERAIKEVLVEGHHYGTIPGTEGPPGPDGKKAPAKKVLLKPGAEALCSLFRLTPQFDVTVVDLPNDHREVRTNCTLTQRSANRMLGYDAYRWRLASRKCPDCGADAIRKGKEGGFFCGKKVGGCGANFQEGDRRIIDQEQGRQQCDRDEGRVVLQQVEGERLEAGFREGARVVPQGAERPPVGRQRQAHDRPGRPRRGSGRSAPRRR